MDTFRKEVAGLGLLWFSMTMIGYTLMKLLLALPYQDTMQLVILEFIVLFLGCLISPLFFFQFGYLFVECVIESRRWSSTWTWLMHFPSFQRAFVTGEYVGFRRLCVLISGACIMTYVIPSFYQKGIMALPAFSLIMSSVFIVLGFFICRKKDINEH